MFGRTASSLRTALCALLCMVPVAQAHHSYEFNYDGAKLLTMAGTVKLFAIENPHSRIVVETRKPTVRPKPGPSRRYPLRAQRRGAIRCNQWRSSPATA